jgi:uncharacterized membrane protein YkvA (DUF1232 family)
MPKGTTTTAVVVHDAHEDRLWEKLRRFGKRAGRIVVERALRLFYAAQDPSTPAWAKRAIYAALAYFIVPFDLIPDFVPGIGFTDDAATLLFTLFVVSAYVSRDIKIRARVKTDEWLGPR